VIEALPLDVVISVVDHDNEQMTRRCLASLPAACDGVTWRVVLIENVLVAGIEGRLRRANPHIEIEIVVNARPRGFGANHNRTLASITGGGGARYVLVLNDDTVLAHGTVRELVRHLDERRGDGAAAPVVLSPEGRACTGRFAYPTLRSALRHDAGHQFGELPAPDGWLQGCCLLLRTEAVREVGNFDERYFLFYEDADLSRRLADAGWGLSVCATARVTHFAHATVLRGASAATTPRQGLRSRYLYLARHHGPRVATTSMIVGRALLVARAAAAGGGIVGGPGRRRRAQDLLRLARYDPRRPVHDETLEPHEAGRGVPSVRGPR
jgi:GT2 family glycosyltransferase